MAISKGAMILFFGLFALSELLSVPHLWLAVVAGIAAIALAMDR